MESRQETRLNLVKESKQVSYLYVVFPLTINYMKKWRQRVQISTELTNFYWIQFINNGKIVTAPWEF